MSQEPSEPDGASSDDDGPLTVRDDQLPDDLQPSDDNPLAQPVDDDVPDDLLQQEAAHRGSGTDSEDAATGVDDTSGSSSSTASSEARSEEPDDSPSA